MWRYYLLIEHRGTTIYQEELTGEEMSMLLDHVRALPMTCPLRLHAQYEPMLRTANKDQESPY